MHDYSAGVNRTEWPKAMFKGDDSKNVSEDGYEAALADGWRLGGVVEPVSIQKAPSRADLEAKAAEIGLKFDGRTPDKKLAAAIAAASKG